MALKEFAKLMSSKSGQRRPKRKFWESLNPNYMASPQERQWSDNALYRDLPEDNIYESDYTD